MKFPKLFRRNQKTNPLFFNTLLAVAMVFILFVGNTRTVFADYDSYINLFGTYTDTDPVPEGTTGAKESPPKESGLFYWGASKDDSDKGITKFYLGFNLILPGLTNQSTLAEAKDKWDYVAGDGANQADIFLLHIYGTDSSGKKVDILQPAPYRVDYTKKDTSYSTGGVIPPATITNTSAQYSTSLYQYNADTSPNSYFVNQQAVALISGQTIPYGTVLSADFWYCGGRAGDKDGDFKEKAIPSELNDSQKAKIAFFKDKCDDTAYYKIGPTITFTLPSSAVDSTGFTTEDTIKNQVSSKEQTTGINPGDNLPECGIIQGSVLGCVAQIVYGLIFKPISIVAALFGKLFDFFIGYSISDESYRMAFAVRGWQLVRDISNIFFIIILVWTGFSTVFFNKSSMKQIVPALIINAIIINFSLFATRTVIDISNVTSRVFYSRIYVCNGPCEDKNNDGQYDNLKRDSTTGYWPLSEQIVSVFNPQKILSPSTASPYLLKPGGQTTNETGRGSTDIDANLNASGSVNDLDSQSKAAAAGGLSISSSEYAAYFIIVTLIGAAIMFAILKMFWGIAFMFLGRTIGLYVAMIFSPFAFLSREIPMLSKIERLSWQKWTGELTQYALLAPIFIFYLYIVYAFLSTNLLSEFGLQAGGYSFFENVLYIAIPMLIIYFLVDYGKKLASDYAGEAGKMVQKWGEKATGFVTGAALGATALVGGRVIGGLAAKADESKIGMGIRNMASKGGITGWAGKNLQKGLNATRGGSFDVRQSTAGQAFFKNIGMDTNQKGLNALAGVGLGLGTDQRAGGRDADIKRRQERKESEAELLEEKHADVYNAKEKKRHEDDIDRIIDAKIAQDLGKSLGEVRDMKENNKAAYTAARTTASADATTKAAIAKVAPPALIKSNAELTTARRSEYAKNLAKGGLATQLIAGIAQDNPKLGKIFDAVYTPIGAITGSGVRTTADRKAAKKVEEKTKIEKELKEIEDTLKNGFRDFIAMDKFLTSPSFTSLSAPERQELVRDGVISTAGANKGKGMYEILDDNEKKIVDEERESLDKKENKDQRENYEDLVKTRERNRYNLKKLQADVKRLKGIWDADPDSTTKRDDWRIKLTEVKNAEKHEEKYRDLNNYLKTRRDKLKGEEKK